MLYMNENGTEIKFLLVNFYLSFTLNALNPMNEPLIHKITYLQDVVIMLSAMHSKESSETIYLPGIVKIKTVIIV